MVDGNIVRQCRGTGIADMKGGMKPAAVFFLLILLRFLAMAQCSENACAGDYAAYGPTVTTDEL